MSIFQKAKSIVRNLPTRFEVMRRAAVRQYYYRTVVSILETEMRPCPLCGNTDDFKPLYDRDRYGLPIKTQQCATCGLVMTQPAPTQKFLDTFYSTPMYRGMYRGLPKARKGVSNELSWEKAELNASLVDKHIRLPEDAAVFDFGTSEGSNLIKLKERHPAWKVYGLEPGVNYGHVNRDKMDGFYTDMEQLPADLQFDLITLWHVLEHLPNPVETLSLLLQHLKRGGRIAIEVPDQRKYDSIHYIHIGHLYHYNDNTLASLAKKLGLEVEFMTDEDVVGKPCAIRMVFRKP